ncbi:hypothetical protein TSMEX_011817 [Taenia solium]|eukprot:TsM_000336300 transcript=TsM_000336300 gene=TsM_000336300
MPKKNVKGSLIPPLDFVAPVSVGKIPFNNEFIQCTAKHPPVKTVVSEEQPPWIEPHFDSPKRQPHPRAASAFACGTSSCFPGLTGTRTMHKFVFEMCEIYLEFLLGDLTLGRIDEQQYRVEYMASNVRLELIKVAAVN